MTDTPNDAGAEPRQLSRADLASLSPAEIVRAKEQGRLRDVMAGVEVTDSGLDAPPAQLTREALRSMSAAEIVQARADGRRTSLLQGETPA